MLLNFFILFYYMNQYFILMLSALFSAIISSINSVNIKNIDILTLLFIQYATISLVLY